MVVYRICNRKYRDSILSGACAEQVGGRWNEVGVKAVYCSETVSLALLEYYVHSQNISYLPGKIEVAKIEFPGNLKVHTLSVLPDNWNHYPYDKETSCVFGKMVKKENLLALRVPSALVPYEYNVILNPLHSDFRKVKVTEFLELSVDQRLRR